MAVHLNLPEHRKEYSQVYRKALWLALGLLAPEVVVWNAWRQRSEMKELSRTMRGLGFMAEEVKMQKRVRAWFARAVADIQVFFYLKAKDLPELAGSFKRQKKCHHRTHPWTDVHSWYAVMGGFAFEDTSAEEFQFMPGDRTRITLAGRTVD